MKKLSAVFDFPYSVDDDVYSAAERQFRAYVSRNPSDRFTKSDQYIIENCALQLEKKPQSDCRHLIGEFVDVPGKGWS